MVQPEPHPRALSAGRAEGLPLAPGTVPQVVEPALARAERAGEHLGLERMHGSTLMGATGYKKKEKDMWYDSTRPHKTSSLPTGAIDSANNGTKSFVGNVLSKMSSFIQNT